MSAFLSRFIPTSPPPNGQNEAVDENQSQINKLLTSLKHSQRIIDRRSSAQALKSSSSTLHFEIACQGLPTLVEALEKDCADGDVVYSLLVCLCNVLRCNSFEKNNDSEKECSQIINLEYAQILMEIPKFMPTIMKLLETNISNKAKNRNEHSLKLPSPLPIKCTFTAIQLLSMLGNDPHCSTLFCDSLVAIPGCLSTIMSLFDFYCGDADAVSAADDEVKEEQLELLATESILLFKTILSRRNTHIQKIATFSGALDTLHHALNKKGGLKSLKNAQFVGHLLDCAILLLEWQPAGQKLFRQSGFYSEISYYLHCAWEYFDGRNENGANHQDDDNYNGGGYFDGHDDGNQVAAYEIISQNTIRLFKIIQALLPPLHPQRGETQKELLGDKRITFLLLPFIILEDDLIVARVLECLNLCLCDFREGIEGFMTFFVKRAGGEGEGDDGWSEEEDGEGDDDMLAVEVESSTPQKTHPISKTTKRNRKIKKQPAILCLIQRSLRPDCTFECKNACLTLISTLLSFKPWVQIQIVGTLHSPSDCPSAGSLIVERLANYYHGEDEVFGGDDLSELMVACALLARCVDGGGGGLVCDGGDEEGKACKRMVAMHPLHLKQKNYDDENDEITTTLFAHCTQRLFQTMGKREECSLLSLFIIWLRGGGMMGLHWWLEDGGNVQFLIEVIQNDYCLITADGFGDEMAGDWWAECASGLAALLLGLLIAEWKSEGNEEKTLLAFNKTELIGLVTDRIGLDNYFSCLHRFTVISGEKYVNKNNSTKWIDPLVARELPGLIKEIQNELNRSAHLASAKDGKENIQNSKKISNLRQEPSKIDLLNAEIDDLKQKLEHIQLETSKDDLCATTAANETHTQQIEDENKRLNTLCQSLTEEIMRVESEHQELLMCLVDYEKQLVVIKEQLLPRDANNLDFSTADSTNIVDGAAGNITEITKSTESIAANNENPTQSTTNDFTDFVNIDQSVNDNFNGAGTEDSCEGVSPMVYEQSPSSLPPHGGKSVEKDAIFKDNSLDV